MKTVSAKIPEEKYNILQSQGKISDVLRSAIDFYIHIVVYSGGIPTNSMDKYRDMLLDKDFLTSLSVALKKELKK